MNKESRVGTVVVGRYRLLECVRREEFLQTYTASDTLLPKSVTIDIIETQDSAFLSRALAGYTSTERATHSAIARTELVSSEDRFGIAVLESLGGTSLADARKGSLMSPGAVALLASQLCAGVACFHEARLVHGDIRPDNIFLLPGSNGACLPKIAGFYATTPLNEFAPDAKPVVGSPYYMSREALGGHLGYPSDVFSLGATIFEALTGKRLRRGKTFVELALSDTRPCRSLAPDLNHRIASIIDACSDPNPEHRPTASQLAESFNSIAEELRAPTVVILYAARDRSFAEELREHLRVMERENIIAIWALDDVLPGENFESALLRHAQYADILVPLLSAQFLGSDLFWSIMNWAKHRAKWLMPVLVRACDWGSMPLDRVVLPAGRVPVASFRHRDEAWRQLVEKIREVLHPSGTLHAPTWHAPTPPSSRRPALDATSISLPGQYRDAYFARAYVYDVLSPTMVELARQALQARIIAIIGTKEAGAEVLGAMIFNASSDAVWLDQRTSTDLLRRERSDGATPADEELVRKMRACSTLVLANFGHTDSNSWGTSIVHEPLLTSRQAAGLQTVVLTSLPRQGFVYFYGSDLAQLVYGGAVINLYNPNKEPVT